MKAALEEDDLEALMEQDGGHYAGLEGSNEGGLVRRGTWRQPWRKAWGKEDLEAALEDDLELEAVSE